MIKLKDLLLIAEQQAKQQTPGNPPPLTEQELQIRKDFAKVLNAKADVIDYRGEENALVVRLHKFKAAVASYPVVIQTPDTDTIFWCRWQQNDEQAKREFNSLIDTVMGDKWGRLE